jgi:hypothetical protein
MEASPWSYNEDLHQVESFDKETGNRVLVIKVSSWTPVADALLVSASKELLKALKWALSTVNREPCEWTCQEDAAEHEAALAAIKKAEGRE